MLCPICLHFPLDTVHPQAVQSCPCVYNSFLTLCVHILNETRGTYVLIKSTSYSNIHLGTNGNDANPGSIDRPFKTITFARDYIRQLKNTSKFPVGGVVVNVRSGSYEFTSEPLSLTAEDSGEPNSPVV